MTKTEVELRKLREQAVELRRAGRSVRQIRQALGPVSNATLGEALQGVPPPSWTRRPNAKDDLRARARELRGQGLRYKDIATQLNVSMSSVSLWVRDLPTPPRLLPEASKQRSIEGTRRWWAREREVREAQRSSDVAAAAAQIGNLSERELLIAGAIAYWCEGEKAKPHRRSYGGVNFINSDPGLLLLFLRFLNSVGVPRAQLRYRVHIHETAGVAAATHYWCNLADASPEQFVKPNIKHHNPRTVRKNTGADYHGCLQIRALKSAALYRKIEGWASAIMSET